MRGGGGGAIKERPAAGWSIDGAAEGEIGGPAEVD